MVHSPSDPSSNAEQFSLTSWLTTSARWLFHSCHEQWLQLEESRSPATTMLTVLRNCLDKDRVFPTTSPTNIPISHPPETTSAASHQLLSQITSLLREQASLFHSIIAELERLTLTHPQPYPTPTHMSDQPPRKFVLDAHAEKIMARDVTRPKVSETETAEEKEGRQKAELAQFYEKLMARFPKKTGLVRTADK